MVQNKLGPSPIWQEIGPPRFVVPSRSPGKFGPQKFGCGRFIFICIGYILPTIGESMSVEFIYWYKLLAEHIQLQQNKFNIKMFSNVYISIGNILPTIMTLPKFPGARFAAEKLSGSNLLHQHILGAQFSRAQYAAKNQ